MYEVRLLILKNPQKRFPAWFIVTPVIFKNYHPSNFFAISALPNNYLDQVCWLNYSLDSPDLANQQKVSRGLSENTHRCSLSFILFQTHVKPLK